MRTLLSLAFGKLPFYFHVADFDFDAAGAIGVPGEVVRLPLHGDLYGIVDAKLINEISARLAFQQADYRQRLQRACDFFNMALDQRTRHSAFPRIR